MQRWHKDKAIMLKRWRQEIALHGGHDGWKLPPFTYGVGLEAPIPPITCDSPPCHCYAGPGFFRKRKPMDCGNPRCGHCHCGKWDRARHNEKLAAIRFELEANGL